MVMANQTFNDENKKINTVEKIRGNCPIYKTGGKIVINKFYKKPKYSLNVCIHAFAAMTTLLSAVLYGTSALELGMGSEEDVDYLQCPDPGPPYTKGETFLFKLKRGATK
jgi:uncharacterized repeat protein (TIGR04076 family)